MCFCYFMFTCLVLSVKLTTTLARTLLAAGPRQDVWKIVSLSQMFGLNTCSKTEWKCFVGLKKLRPIVLFPVVAWHIEVGISVLLGNEIFP